MSVTAIGRTDDVCPSCGHALKKRPSRKTKCDACGNAIFVRTRPLDRIRVLVTENQAAELDEQWDTMRPSLPARIARLDDYKGEIASFAEKLNRNANDPDLRWLFLNQRIILLAQRGEWGVYSNTRMEMAAVLQEEGRGQDALRTFLEVCYIDLNGPTNMGSFSVDQGFLAPAIVDQVINLSAELQLGEAEVQREFMAIASRVHDNLKLPMSPQVAWERLRNEVADD